MTVHVPDEDQSAVNRLRIDLAQAAVDLAEVQTNDIASRHAKEKATVGLRLIRNSLDQLGIRHASMMRCANDQH